MNLGLDTPEHSPKPASLHHPLDEVTFTPSLSKMNQHGVHVLGSRVPGPERLHPQLWFPEATQAPIRPPPSEQAEVLAAPRETLGGLRGHRSIPVPINGTAPRSPDLPRVQSALSAPGEKNAHLLGEEKVELWLKPLCLQQQLFNPFVWCMKSVPRTQRLLITVGLFPSLQINWQRPLVPSFWMLLLFRAEKWSSPRNPCSFLHDLGIAQRPLHSPSDQPSRPGGLAHCLSSLAGSACWSLCFHGDALSLQGTAMCTSPPG